MLSKENKIFRNLHGFYDWKLKAAMERGIWSNTNKIIEQKRKVIIDGCSLGI